MTRLSYGQALEVSAFRAVFAEQLLSVGGLSVGAVALTVLVFRRTGSPLLASLTFALSFLPYLVGGGLLSGLVDRVRPRGLIAGTELIAAGLIGVIAIPGIPLPLVFVALAANGTLASLASGARAALVRAAVPTEAYVPARSLLRIAAQLAQIAGNAAGGTLLALLSPRGVLLATVGLFVLASLTVRLAVANYDAEGTADEARLLRDSLRGARQILALPELRRLLLFGWLAPLFAIAPEPLAAPYVAAHHGSPQLVGWWLVALPAGLIAGDFAGVRLLSAYQQRRMVAPAAAVGFLPYLAFALDPPIAPAMALLCAAGVSGMYALGLDARVRDAAPPALFARTMTLSSGGLMALQGIGFALAGALAQATSPHAAIVIAGCCGLITTVVLLREDLFAGTE